MKCSKNKTATWNEGSLKAIKLTCQGNCEDCKKKKIKKQEAKETKETKKKAGQAGMQKGYSGRQR